MKKGVKIYCCSIGHHKGHSSDSLSNKTPAQFITASPHKTEFTVPGRQKAGRRRRWRRGRNPWLIQISLLLTFVCGYYSGTPRCRRYGPPPWHEKFSVAWPVLAPAYPPHQCHSCLTGLSVGVALLTVILLWNKMFSMSAAQLVYNTMFSSVNNTFPV